MLAVPSEVVFAFSSSAGTFCAINSAVNSSPTPTVATACPAPCCPAAWDPAFCAFTAIPHNDTASSAAPIKTCCLIPLPFLGCNDHHTNPEHCRQPSACTFACAHPTDGR